MTLPAVTEPQAPPGRVVRVPLSETLILGSILHLDGHLAGASVEHNGGAATLVLYVDHPGAPERADELEPAYTRTACQGQGRCPGQVTLTGLRWRRDGAELRPATWD